MKDREMDRHRKRQTDIDRYTPRETEMDREIETRQRHRETYKRTETQK